MIDPTREEWLDARKRVRKSAGCIVNLDEGEVHRFTTAALGPCPPEPAPAPFRSATRTLVWTSGSTGELHIPAQVLTPDEADAMAKALVAHAHHARKQEATSDA